MHTGDWDKIMNKKMISETLGLSALIVLAYLLDGVAVKILWGWFVTPTFGIAAPNVFQIIGLIILVRIIFCARPKFAKSEAGDDFGRAFAFKFIDYAFVLMLGGLLKLLLL